ncbi:MAG: phenylacetic acid degradation protein [Planctomycetaceae bacterium]|nr:phenylacetic acid degradation protein [Planctomycetaceae bacterium]
MKLFQLSALLPCLLFQSIVCAEETQIPDSLERYVRAEDRSFAWERLRSTKTELGTVHQLKLTSQTWHEIVWSHTLMVYEPSKMDHPQHMLLFVTGGTTGRVPKKDDQVTGLKLANACGAAVAFLYQVPNQPLLGDRVEDDLITETWLRYLKTGDDTWPLLFPMVKSAVRAMDALEEFSDQHFDQSVEKFVITGASKRGWTSWLTPVVDERIVGTAPIVIDVLNFMKQTQNQKATWGKYSEQIIDYTSKGLVKTSPDEESDRERALRVMMDPYTYRSKLTLPKLMIVGTNDPYWVVDAMNLYWDDLKGPKYVLQVPNAGHGLDGGRENALNTLSIFFQHIASGTPMPDMNWSLKPGNPSQSLDLKTESPIAKATLWKATSADLDFRDAEWKPTELDHELKSLHAQVKIPENGDHIAMFVEITFLFHDRPWSMTTLVYRK